MNNRHGRAYYAFGMSIITVSLAYVLAFQPVGCLGNRGRQPGALQKYEKEPVLSVYVHETGKTMKLPLERYLEGVVAGEMKPGWPEEAYAAQAIVARSFTMEFLERGGTRDRHGTDICTDEEHAQAYDASSITDVIRRAVRRTRGEVMTYNGKFVRGWFSADAGGRTATAKEGLDYKGPEPPYIASVRVPEDVLAPEEVSKWSATFGEDELRRALIQAGKDVGDIRSVEIADKGPSGRVTNLRFTGSKGDAEIAGADLRTLLGPHNMRSTLLTDFAYADGKLTMEGRGFGHGVGMCQWGARGLAQKGWSPERIVKFFYKDIEITKLWD